MERACGLSGRSWSDSTVFGLMGAAVYQIGGDHGGARSRFAVRSGARLWRLRCLKRCPHSGQLDLSAWSLGRGLGWRQRQE